MALSADYVAPKSSAIQSRQNDIDALRLLLAQRRLHSKAKFWQGLRWIGLFVIGLAAPIVSVIWHDLAMAMGAVAGGWLFLGRTALAWRVSTLTTRAAATQEAFDLHVFAMPTTVIRSTLPSLEDIAKLTGTPDEVHSSAESEHLTDWYPVRGSDHGTTAVAIAQRANAAYSDRLLRAAVTLWAVATIVWVLILVALSIFAQLSLPTFLVGVLLPVLPASLDVVEYLVSIRRAARDRADLARSIESGIRGLRGSRVDEQDLLVWQERMFELRCSMPQVPDWLYRVTRKENEAAMQSAADQLRRDAQAR